jgi:2-oxoglutarate dehydrogenase E1 component
MTHSADVWLSDSYLNGANADYLEDQYELFLTNPEQVPEKLRKYFEQWPQVGVQTHGPVRERLRAEVSSMRSKTVAVGSPVSSKQPEIDALILAYRNHGHRKAQLDPLNLAPSAGDARLELESYGLSSTDLQAEFLTRSVLPSKTATLAKILEHLNNIYCQKVGFDYAYIKDQAELDWLHSEIENNFQPHCLSTEDKIALLNELNESEGLEHYLDKRYVGQKRFSIEGLDTMVPLLKQLLRSAAAVSTKAVVIGMAHRGRLNVMYNVVGMQASELFKEFEGKADYGYTSGDVKYHLGLSSDIDTGSGSIHATLSFNPSHLEFINPVIMGTVRARQYCNEKLDFDHDLGITIHGDSAFSGQGVVMESLNMSQLRAYSVGGMIRIIANNQIGFSTSNKHDTRSTEYCCDIGKMMDIPVFHVNADDAESVIAVAKLAFQYRQKFHKDVIIDLIGYRRHGHQEVDEPTATQPIMYQHIKKQPTAFKQYAAMLLEQGICTQEQIDSMNTDLRQLLDDGGSTVKTAQTDVVGDKYSERWAAYSADKWQDEINTAVPLADLKRLANIVSSFPEDFVLCKPVSKIMTARKAMSAGEMPVDWGMAEMLVYASLLDAGVPVRFTGEDSRRGTFYHRHAFLFDSKTGEAYSPLLHVSEHQAKLQLYDSLLSETGALGFEYGYSLADPKSLVMWEAQYGDFANGGQVITDQFISSAWQKWQRLSGLVMLLPHGNEGAGPEHTSARLERYLQICAQKNMQVCVPTTPAQIFHLLRRQVLRSCRIPLVIMSPKSFLRHKLAASSLDELANGSFQTLIPEHEFTDKAEIKHVILCSGKVYYDLLEERKSRDRQDIAVLRIEQLYPFPYEKVEQQLRDYGHVEDITWCQEESKNHGAWYITRDRLTHCLAPGQKLRLASRPSAASPAAGYRALHLEEQKLLLAAAMGEASAIEDLD